MTLDELDEKLAAEKVVTTTVVVPTTYRDAEEPKRYSETHGEWLRRRTVEDSALKHNKCPLCSADVEMTIVNQVTHYNCTREKDHKFSRWAGLHVANDRLLREYSRDDDGGRYWE